MRNVAVKGRDKEGIKMIEYQKGEREEYKLYDRGVQEREEKMGWGEKKVLEKRNRLRKEFVCNGGHKYLDINKGQLYIYQKS